MIKKTFLLLFLWLTFSLLAKEIHAEDMKSTLEMSMGYDYGHVSDNLPLEDLKNYNFLMAYTTGNESNQFFFRGEVNGNSGNYDTKLDELSISRKNNQFLYSIGKQKWVWGKGFSYIPTCPLYTDPTDKDNYYWGLEGSLINPKNSYTIGAAKDKDSDKDYTSWFRSGYSFETSDLTLVTSYQSLFESWNYGVDYSYDLLNGFEFHSGINVLNPRDSGSMMRYLVGGEYISKYNLIFEVYHGPVDREQQKTDDLFILVFNNSAQLFERWQWEFQATISLTDDGQMRKCTIKYLKNSILIPELEIIMYSGPKSSYFKSNPYDYTITFKLTSKF